MLSRVINKVGRKLIGNSLWLLIDKLIRLLVGLFIGVMVARYLGPEKMGIYNYCLAIFTFFILFPSLGLEYVAPREFVKRSNESQQLLNTAMLLKFVGATLGIVVSTVFMGFLKGFDNQLVLFVFILSTGYLFQSFDVIDYYYQSNLKQKNSVLARLAAFLLVSAYKFYLIQSQAPLVWFIASSTIEFAFGAVALLYSFRKEKIHLSLKYFSQSMAKDLLKDSLILSVSGLIIVLYYKVDQVMITEMLGERENGIYSVSIRIYELFTFIPAVLIASYLPVITKKYGEEEAQFRTTLKQLYTLLTYLAIFLTVAVWVFGPVVMDFLYRENYAGSGEVLQILGLGFYFVFMAMGIGNYLIIRNLKKFIFIKSVLGLALNIGLNLWLIPIYGIKGAAVTSLFSNFISTFLILALPSNHQHFQLILSPFNFASIKRFMKY